MPDWKSFYQDSIGDDAPPLPARLKLPAVPECVVNYTLLAEETNVGVGALSAAIKADPSLAAELLKYVNSATFGLANKIRSIPRAIVALGTRRTQMLLLTGALRQSLGRCKSRLIDTRRFHQDNLERALFSREIARILNTDEDCAYSAALIQDLLLPILSETYPEEYGLFFKSQDALSNCEHEQFGWDHSRLMARLLHDWQFPEDLVAAVRLHHESGRVLERADLEMTPAAATAAAALLPDSLGQTVDGLERLFDLQERHPSFLLLEAAASVDDELGEGVTPTGHRVGLCDRLSTRLISRLEEERVRTVEVSRQIGNYLLEEKLGEGGMGVVYRGRHRLLKRPCAIKLLNTSRISRRAIDRFEMEVQLTSQLNSKNTIGIYDFGVTESGVFYYVMEYVEGITLSELLQFEGPIPEARVVRILRQICDSLFEAHGCGLIHRDIKPDNVMLTQSGTMDEVAKVLDFGLAKLIAEDTSGDRSLYGLSGTPDFMAPEAVTSPLTVDVRTDIYAVGAVGYYLLTGQTLFPATDLHTLLLWQVERVPLCVSERLGQEVNPDLEDAIMACIAKEPQSRPISAEVLSDRLERCRISSAWTRSSAVDWWQRYRNSAPGVPDKFDSTVIVTS